MNRIALLSAFLLLISSVVPASAQGVITREKPQPKTATTAPTQKRAKSKTSRGIQSGATEKAPAIPRPTLRTSPRHLDRVVSFQDTTLTGYLSNEAFEALPAYWKNRINSSSMVIDRDGETFIIDMNLYVSSWDDAMLCEAHGMHLPTLEQAKAISNDHDAISHILNPRNAAAGVKLAQFWTSERVNDEQSYVKDRVGPWVTAAPTNVEHPTIRVIKTLKSAALTPRTFPAPLDIEVIRDGKAFYFTPQEWQNLDKSHKNDLNESNRYLYSANGIVIDDGRHRFVLLLDEPVRSMTFDEARQTGLLPSLDEAKAILDNLNDLQKASQTAFQAWIDNGIYYCGWTSALASDNDVYMLSYSHKELTTSPILVGKKKHRTRNSMPAVRVARVGTYRTH